MSNNNETNKGPDADDKYTVEVTDDEIIVTPKEPDAKKNNEQDVNPHGLMKSWIKDAEKIYAGLIEKLQRQNPETFIDFIYDRNHNVSIKFKNVEGLLFDPMSAWSEGLRDSQEYVPTNFYVGNNVVIVTYKLKSMVK